MKNRLLEHVLFWITGMWALGLGFRMSYGLIKYGKYTITGIVWLDWIPLGVLGGLTAIVAIIRIKRELWG